jgi:hypothetical protein
VKNIIAFCERQCYALRVENETYKQTLETATAEMSDLLRQRQEIEARIGKLAPLIEYLSSLCDQLPPPALPMPSELDLGLSDAIRLAFRSASPQSLAPTEVRDKLRESGFNLDKYANELPPIHNTIIRLLKNGEIEESVPKRDGKAYKWVSSLKRALLEIEPKFYGGGRMTGSLKDMVGAQPETVPSRAVTAAGSEGASTEPPLQPKKETWITRATKK